MNTTNDITNLYNNLFKLEEKFRKEEAYPIHKRLYFDQNIKDIYEYLDKELIEILTERINSTLRIVYDI